MKTLPFVPLGRVKAAKSNGGTSPRCTPSRAPAFLSRPNLLESVLKYMPSQGPALLRLRAHSPVTPIPRKFFTAPARKALRISSPPKKHQTAKCTPTTCPAAALSAVLSRALPGKSKEWMSSPSEQTAFSPAPTISSSRGVSAFLFEGNDQTEHQRNGLRRLFPARL